jgi:hypothetical protein
LNGLFSTMKQAPTTWATYLQAVDKASTYYTNIQSSEWLLTAAAAFASAKIAHSYGGGVPRGLYFLMSYAAYELPFAWWFRCSWLSWIFFCN